MIHILPCTLGWVNAHLQSHQAKIEIVEFWKKSFPMALPTSWGIPKCIFWTLGLSDKWAVEAFLSTFGMPKMIEHQLAENTFSCNMILKIKTIFLAKIVLISLIIYAINYHMFKFGEIRSIFLTRRTDLVCLDKIVIFAKILSCKNQPELFPPRHTPVNFSQNDPLIYRHLPKLRFAAATCSHGSQTTSKLSQNWQNCIPLHA